MFTTVGQVVRALKAFADYYHPKSSGILSATSNRNRDIDADPFRRGFLDNLDLRAKLLSRLSSLEERERSVIMLWYVMDRPVAEICEKLSLSRSHAYRVRDNALAGMTDDVALPVAAGAYA